MDLLATLTSWIVVFIPVLMLAFGVSEVALSRTIPGKTTLYTMLTFGLVWLGTLGALGLVIFNGPINITLLTVANAPVFGFLLDRLSLVIVLLVVTVSGIVHLYSLRAMHEERDFRRYFAFLTLITLEVVLVVFSNNLLMLAIFWILKGFTLTLLISHYHDRKASWQAALRKLSIDLVGYVAFLAALFLTWNIFGSFDLGVINTQAATIAQSQSDYYQLTLLTILLFVAIMAKSAQFPFHSWLPGSVEAPTPVSALMHAGLINAGGFLFIRLSPLFVATPVTMGVAIAIGGFTAFFGTLIMLTRNDVKGMLVYSTMGQMGFMILECGLGAFGLAALHLVAHGLFKATLFLSAGSVIQKKGVIQLIAPSEHSPTGNFGTVRLLSTGILAGLVLFFVPGLLGFSVNTGTILLAFAWFTLLYALTELDKLPLVFLLPGTLVITLVYLVGIHGVELFFKPTVAANPKMDFTVIMLSSAGLVLVGLLALILKSPNRPAWLNRLFTRLYVRALFTGYGK